MKNMKEKETEKEENIRGKMDDRESAFHYIFNDLKKESSIISEIFFGYNETTNECLNCKKIIKT